MNMVYIERVCNELLPAVFFLFRLYILMVCFWFVIVRRKFDMLLLGIMNILVQLLVDIISIRLYMRNISELLLIMTAGEKFSV